MALQQFTIGARVLVSGLGRLLAPDGVYTIVRALPTDKDDGGQYRVKSDAEAFERIVDAYRLTEAPLA